MVKHNYKMKLFVALILFALVAFLAPQDYKKSDAKVEIDAFNRAFDAAILKQNNAAVLALWDEEGLSLLPATPPIRGKKEMSKFLEDVTAQTKGWKVLKQESTCHDIEVSVDWASEWCDTYQMATRPDSQPNWEGWGKTLLVLHRDKNGRWLLKREMWNLGIKP